MRPSALQHAVDLKPLTNEGVVLDPRGDTRPRDISDCIEADNPVAALALDELFEEKAGRLGDHPGLGRSGRTAGACELVAHKNYILVYDVTVDLVRVLRVFRAARQWPSRNGIACLSGLWMFVESCLYCGRPRGAPLHGSRPLETQIRRRIRRTNPERTHHAPDPTSPPSFLIDRQPECQRDGIYTIP